MPHDDHSAPSPASRLPRALPLHHLAGRDPLVCHFPRPIPRMARRSALLGDPRAQLLDEEGSESLSQGAEEDIRTGALGTGVAPTGRCPMSAEPRRYLTHDCDQARVELVVQNCDNGDWYISIVREGHMLGRLESTLDDDGDRGPRATIRVVTSGERREHRGVAAAVADLWRALGDEGAEYGAARDVPGSNG